MSLSIAKAMLEAPGRALGTVSDIRKRSHGRGKRERRKSWGLWVRRARKQQGLLMCQLAHAVCICPTYLTLIERDGYVPSRDIAENLGRVLDSPEAALIEAGYLPPTLKGRALDAVDEKQRRNLDPITRQIVALLTGASERVRTQARDLVSVLVCSGGDK